MAGGFSPLEDALQDENPYSSETVRKRGERRRQQDRQSQLSPEIQNALRQRGGGNQLPGGYSSGSNNDYAGLLKAIMKIFGGGSSGSSGGANSSEEVLWGAGQTGTSDIPWDTGI
jgi:hypothetical protein